MTLAEKQKIFEKHLEEELFRATTEGPPARYYSVKRQLDSLKRKMNTK